MNRMLNQYIATMFWASSDDVEYLDSLYDFSDLSEEALTASKKDLEEFVKKAGSLVDGLDDTDIAHDFWLTRNGHGVGFWDRKYSDEIDPEGNLGDRLTEIAKTFKEVHPYVGDDGKIYLHEG